MKYQTKYIHISSGRGPAECCWVVAQVKKEITAYCNQVGIHTVTVSSRLGPQNGTLRSTLIEVKGERLLTKLAIWSGTIQWIGRSPYRRLHKRKNWFVSLEILDAMEDQRINLSELQFQTFRASGPGGQHRNKVETAVRAIHKPSGLSASAMDSRSQHQNKQNAIRKIKAMIQEFNFQKTLDQVEDQWKQHTSLERGNAVKIFEGAKFKERK